MGKRDREDEEGTAEALAESVVNGNIIYVCNRLRRECQGNAFTGMLLLVDTLEWLGKSDRRTLIEALRRRTV